MSFQFERPVGAAADAMELEYVAALHQVDDESDWRDASIEVPDVKYFLMSRYGIDASDEDIRHFIFSGLAGGDSDSNCIDIIEIVAILLIPYLVKAAKADLVEEEGDSTPEDMNMNRREKKMFDSIMIERKSMMKIHSSIIEDVLKIILADSTGSSEPQLLTKDLLRQIFARYNELDLIDDEELLDEMIELASGGKKGVMLDGETFARALTDDLWLYNQKTETSYSTNYQDVFGNDDHPTSNDLELEEEGKEEEEDKVEIPESFSDEYNRKRKTFKTEPRDVKRVFTFPSIDSMADTYRNSGHFAIAYMAFIFLYLSYFNPFQNDFVNVCKEENKDRYGCKVGNSIVAWIFVMFTMIILGPPIVISFSLGNNPHRISIFEVLGGVLGIGLFIIFPILHEFDAKIFTTVHVEEPAFALIIDIINWTLAGILGMYQIINISRLLQKRKFRIVNKLSFFKSFLIGSAAKNEMAVKTASSLKIHKMVMNAYEMHQPEKEEKEEEEDKETNLRKSTFPQAPPPGESTHALALLNFTKVSEKVETTGGFKWGWTQFFTGSLLHKEGIWIHTKTIAANLSQFFVVAIVTAMLISIYYQVYHAIFGPTPPKILKCNAAFNYDSCQFVQDQYGEYKGMAFCTDMFIMEENCLDENFVPLDGELKELFCSFFESDPTLADLDFPYTPDLGVNACPDVFFSHPDTINAYTYESNEEGYCGAPITACAPVGPYFNGQQRGICLIGMAHFLPFQFEGPTCPNYPEIAKLLEDKEQFEEDFDYMPRKWMMNTSFIFGIVAAFVLGTYNALVTIPSHITVVLQFRSGVIPSLRDEGFKLYRRNMFQTSMLLGATVWSSFLMSVVIFAVVAVFVFLLAWQGTRDYVLSFTAFLIGVLVTLICKIVVTLILANYHFEGFYRKYPAFCNIVNVAYECWHLALTAGYVIARAIKIIIISIAYLGRFDRPLLADGVGQLGPINLDNFPFVFRKDILLTESHRHPYIERLGLMYMLKLRHGVDFAYKSGSTWRLLFVFALMPWLTKYRIKDEEEVEQGSFDERKKTAERVMSAGKHKSVATLEAEVKALKAQVEELKRNQSGGGLWS